jgi:hypothetical protein
MQSQSDGPSRISEREEAAPDVAVDASLDRRPGVPQQQSPSPVGHAHWAEPERQPVPVGAVKDAQRPEWTATFGTGQPPKGLSGVMRRAAYRIPDYRIRRWLLLLVADRVDALEHRGRRASARPSTWMALAGLAFGFGYLRLRAARRASRIVRRLFAEGALAPIRTRGRAHAS